MNKALQYFTDEYLESCKNLDPYAVLQFLEDFRQLNSPQKKAEKSQLISIKIPKDLLRAFKTKAALNEVPYQTQIKILMKDWIQSS